MDLKALAATLMGSVNNTPTYGAPVLDSPTTAPVLQNIRNAGALTSKGNMADRAIGALGGAANEQASQDSAAAAMARKKQEDEAQAAQDELDARTDPRNYKAIINDVGGYDFYDAAGGKISAVEYAKVKNLQLSDVYKDSQDPNDKDFVDDYKRVTQLGKIIQTGDKAGRDKFFKENPDFKEIYGKSSLGEIVSDLHELYPGYFRSEKQQVQGANSAQGGWTMNNLDSNRNIEDADKSGNDKRGLAKRFGDLLNPRR